MICAKKTFFKYGFRRSAFEQVGCQDYCLIVKKGIMKTPNFENGQIILEPDGSILEASEEFCDWVGQSISKIKGQSFWQTMVSMEKEWGELIPKIEEKQNAKYFLPLGIGDKSSIGIHVTHKNYPKLKISILSITTGLAPHDSLKDAFLGDLMQNPKAIASTLVRLQKAESRLADYISNFPGIFFSQRPDMSFSYLSKGIRSLFPEEYREFSRDSGLFLSKILEQDREHYLNEINSQKPSGQTYSFTYRVVLPQMHQVVYLLDVRTPSITSQGKLLGYDGVLIDITRQAIAEHRLSNSVWREGLATLTNGLVHDFSNLMAGIFSISELYFGMMEKDDPMANGMGQIKKSAMQAQKLVRRIIDLHRQKPANRAVQDLRLLLKDQMDLLEIIIPRSARIKTNFGKEALPAFIEETGFRQVILNLAINARDAIERTGKISISIRKVEEGTPLVSDQKSVAEIAECTGAEVSISDNGKGIPDSIKEKLFDPFFSTKDATKGSGFGLYNSKLFIEDHNGKIGFVSEEGKGSTFFLFIPLFVNEASKKKNLKKERRATREFVKVRRSIPPKA